MGKKREERMTQRKKAEKDQKGKKGEENKIVKQRDVIKCLRARRVYLFLLSPDTHTGLANEKAAHANFQLGNLSVI